MEISGQQLQSAAERTKAVSKGLRDRRVRVEVTQARFGPGPNGQGYIRVYDPDITDKQQTICQCVTKRQKIVTIIQG